MASYDREVTSVLTFTQVAKGRLFASVDDDLTFDSIVDRTLISKRKFKQRITFSQRLKRSLVRPRQVAAAIVFTQKAKASRSYARSVTSTLSFEGEVAGTVTFEDVVSTLALSQVVDGYRAATDSSTSLLAFSQTLTRQTIYNRSVTSTLVFSNTRTVKFNNSAVEVNNTQGVIVNPKGITNRRIIALLPVDLTGLTFRLYQTGILLGQTGLSTKVPVITSSNNYVILNTDSEAITLPAPVFGDSETDTGTLNYRKSMNGTVYTYVKRQNTRKLKYDFEIDRQKSLQLREFIKLTNTSNLTLTNWKGEIWKVRYLTNPFVFTISKRWAPTGEGVAITLEFEGIRIN